MRCSHPPFDRVLPAVLAAAAICLAWTDATRMDRTLHAGPDPVHPDTVTLDDFVGAEVCQGCHVEIYGAWRGSTHGRAGGPPTSERVLPAFDGTPIRFQDATVVPSADGEGRYHFTVNRPGRAQQVYRVDGVVGGGHLEGGGTQGFVSRFDDGTVRFLPFDYSPEAGTWFCNTAWVAGWWNPAAGRRDLRPDLGWVPITPRLKLTDCGDWPPIRILGTDDRFGNCQGCHGSQVQVAFDAGERRYQTDVGSLSINCESCHGPGREHVEWARSGTDRGSPAIDALRNAGKDESLGVCFRCHALKRSLELGWLPGKPLEDHYSLGSSLVGDAPFLPDGKVRTFAYQMNHRWSECYLSGPMTCVSCHEPHGQGYQDIRGRPLESRFDDGQCLGCHAAKGADPTTHTRHAPDSEGSRCVSCHMPYRQHPELGEQIPYARSDHTISIPRPGVDESMGVRSACSLCHGEMSADSLERVVEAWYGPLKPLPPLIAGLARVEAAGGGMARAEAADLLLRPGSDHPMAQIAALDRFAADHLRPDMDELEPTVERALHALAATLDIDLRALALALLDLARGQEPEVARFLEESRKAEGEEARRIRLRWARNLGLLAERYRREGDAGAAAEAYRKALGVQPARADLLLDLASARQLGGAPAEALELYDRSIEAGAPPDLASVALVNRGVLLERLERFDDAEASYRRAIALNPGEALAHVNLGNLHLRRGEAREAREFYRTAVSHAPALADAHYYLAVSSLMLNDPGAALPALRTAVEFDPSNEEARRLLRQLEAAGRTRSSPDTAGGG